MPKSAHEPLLIPALCAEMGDWTYYISFLRMTDLAARISNIESIHFSESLNEWLQRRLTDNAARIAQYLCVQPQRFFNAIVVGTYGGKPQWHEIEVSSRGQQLPDSLEGTLGFLALDGSEILFAIDGQHRVAGIRKAIERNAALGNEEVCAIFVRGVSASKRAKDPGGFERTRRLFSTLNRYAKPVQKRDIIALDEDDVVAIVTRRLVDEYPLFVNKTALTATKNMPPTNQTDFTTIVALYDVLDTCLRTKDRGWADYKKLRPTERDVDKFYSDATSFWNTMCQNFKPLRSYQTSKPEERLARQQRHRTGGHLLFRPIGLLLVARVISDLRKAGSTATQAIERIAKAPMALEKEPWCNLLWDPINRRMLTASENQNVARRLLYHAVGGTLSAVKYSSARLKTELAGVLKKDQNGIKLPQYL